MSRIRKGIQRLLLFVLKKWSTGVEWALRDRAGDARALCGRPAVGRRLRGQRRNPVLPPLQGPRGSSQNGAGLLPLQLPGLRAQDPWERVPTLSPERCHHPVPEFRATAEPPPTRCVHAAPRGPRVSASAVDLPVPTALPAVCPSLPRGPRTSSLSLGPPLTRDTRARSFLQRALRNTTRAAAACDISEVCFPGPWGPKIDFCGKGPGGMRGDLLFPQKPAWSEGRGQ